MTATLADAQTDGAMAQALQAGCALPSEPKGIPPAIDAAISGPADKDRACMKALLIPEARIMFVSLGADGAPTYTLETLDDWIARVKARGHTMLVGGKMNTLLWVVQVLLAVVFLFAGAMKFLGIERFSKTRHQDPAS